MTSSVIIILLYFILSCICVTYLNQMSIDTSLNIKIPMIMLSTVSVYRFITTPIYDEIHSILDNSSEIVLISSVILILVNNRRKPFKDSHVTQ